MLVHQRTGFSYFMSNKSYIIVNTIIHFQLVSLYQIAYKEFGMNCLVSQGLGIQNPMHANRGAKLLDVRLFISESDVLDIEREGLFFSDYCIHDHTILLCFPNRGDSSYILRQLNQYSCLRVEYGLSFSFIWPAHEAKTLLIA